MLLLAGNVLRADLRGRVLSQLPALLRASSLTLHRSDLLGLRLCPGRSLGLKYTQAVLFPGLLFLRGRS